MRSLLCKVIMDMFHSFELSVIFYFLVKVLARMSFIVVIKSFFPDFWLQTRSSYYNVTTRLVYLVGLC